MKSTDSLDSFSWYHSFALSANTVIFLNNHSGADCKDSSKTGNLLCVKPRNTCVLKFQERHKTHHKLRPSTHLRLLKNTRLCGSVNRGHSERWQRPRRLHQSPHIFKVKAIQNCTTRKMHHTPKNPKKRNRISPVCKFQRQKENKKLNISTHVIDFISYNQSPKEITVTVLIHVKY